MLHLIIIFPGLPLSGRLEKYPEGSCLFWKFSSVFREGQMWMFELHFILFVCLKKKHAEIHDSGIHCWTVTVFKDRILSLSNSLTYVSQSLIMGIFPEVQKGLQGFFCKRFFHQRPQAPIPSEVIPLVSSVPFPWRNVSMTCLPLYQPICNLGIF